MSKFIPKRLIGSAPGLSITRCPTIFIMVTALRGKAQYRWPPCTF